MYFSCQALVLVALALEGAVAQPAHRHAHSHLHKRQLLDVLKKRVDYNDASNYHDVDWTAAVKGVDWAKVFGKEGAPSGAESTPITTPPATVQQEASPNPPAEVSSSPAEIPSSTAVASPSTKPSSAGTTSSGSGSCVDISQVWSKGDTTKMGATAADVGGNGWTNKAYSAKAKRATAAQDAYKGNLGTPYGSNIIPLSDCNDESPMYTVKFTNGYTDGRDMSAVIWNKIGRLGGLNGAYENSFFMIDLPAGKSASFAFEPDSQVAWSENSASCPRQSGAPGGWTCVWGEANMGPSGGGFTSWDVSSMLNPGNMPGAMTVSQTNGKGVSSVGTCDFHSSSQGSAGQGTPLQEQCNPNVLGGEAAHLEAIFGVNKPFA